MGYILGLSNNYRDYGPVCWCQPPKREFTPLDGVIDPRVAQLRDKYIEKCRQEVRTEAKLVSSLLWATGTLAGLTKGVGVMLAAAIVWLPISALLGTGMYFSSNPCKKDRDLAEFLINEYIQKHPDATQSDVFSYITGEQHHFYTIRCNRCSDHD
jgi:hypothetical protein